MKKTVSTILIALIAFAAVTTVTSSITQAQTIQPTITTDKIDYAPNEQVTIYGSGFSTNANIKVEVTAPDSTGNAVLFTTSDSTGTFVTTYGQPPPLMEGVYLVTATDQTNPAKTATTTFTDKVPKNVYISATTGGKVTYIPWGTGTGTVTVADGQFSLFTVLSGTHVSFTAKPDDGLIFVGWTGEGQSGNTNPSLTIQVGNGIGSSSHPLTAVFGPPLPLPEYPLGALAALGACFAGLLFYKRKSLPLFKHS
jgi:hypothetical protein